MYSFGLLGPVALSGPSGPVTGKAGQPRQLALLALLATAGEAGRSRDKLQAILWPESPTESARHSLADAVYRLRKALGEGCVRSEGQTLHLNPQIIRTDIEFFRRCLEERRLEEAVGSYRGPFLDGFHLRASHEFEEWREEEARRFGKAYEEALQVLAGESEAKEDFQSASRFWELLTVHDPLNTRFMMGWMRTLAAANDPGNAIQVGSDHGRLLKEELGAEPPPEFLALLEQLKSGGKRPGAGINPPADPLEAEGVPGVTESASSAGPPGPLRLTGEAPGPPPPLVSTSPTRRRPPAIRLLGLLLVLAATGIAVVAAGRSILGPSRDPGPPWIAVLPPLTPGFPDGAGFAEGLATEIRRRLSLVSGLRVPAYYTAANYPRNGKTYQEMGADFRVDYLLNLSVFRHPGRDSIGSIRVDAELIDARSEESESVGAFSGRLESGFEMHREIAQGIVQKLDLTLAAPEREALESNPTDNRLALEYLQEAHRVNRQGATRAINLRAAELARMAIAEDSSFALAYAELAVVLFAAGQEEDVRLGQEALARARALDPDLPQAQLPNGYFLYSQGHFEEAAEVWRERLQSRPSDPDVLHILGLVERRLGHWVESLDLLERAVDLDPLNPLLLGNLAWTYLRVRDYENADTLLMRRATVFSANDPRAVASLAQSQAWLQLQHRGDIAGAERVLRQAVEEVGLEAVLGVLATNDVKYLWFSLPDWGFRKELRESSVEEVDAHPGNYYLARAVSEEAEGDTAGAEAYYDSVRVVMESQETLSATGHSGLGMAYAGLGRVEEAISEAEEGARMRSVSMDAVAGTWNLMYLARVLVMAGKHERAVEVLDSLMTLPSDWSRTWLDINPFFDPLRNRSDFQALIEGSQSG